MLKDLSAQFPKRLKLLPSKRRDLQGALSFDFSAHFAAEVPVDGVIMGHLSKNMPARFLGINETSVPLLRFNTYRLERGSLDLPLICELGDRFESCFAHIWQLLIRDATGDDVLERNGARNIFFARDVKRVVWAMNLVRHHGIGGWSLGARSLETAIEWEAGHQVIAPAP